MKYLFFLLLSFFTFTAFAQVETLDFEEVYFSDEDSTFYLKSQNDIEIGDTSDIVKYLYEAILYRKQREALAVRNYQNNRGLGKANQLLNQFSTESYYNLTDSLLAPRFEGKYKFTILDTVYQAETYRTAGGLFKMDIKNVGKYTIRIISKNSFELRAFEGSGLHADFYLYDKRNNGRKVFFDINKSYKAVKL